MKRIISILALVGILFAQEKSELIIDIEQSLMATCCWSGTVYDHGNKEMELNITAMVGDGKTKAEILDYYTDQYGERVLAVPKAEGFNIFAWIAPIVIFGLGLTIIFLYVRTSKNNLAPKVKADDTIAYSDEIERELSELD
jgi:cytochrome c-type biogenesis protein CcmH